ncbi:ommochrome-binding protein-like [Leptidea sinapis]|uniref:ommochrome-binding protein-like n=1 Tax=Leptidea sinapis TaxID=189913 RepID=UPI0021C347FE|nr:ommochrome-binding protein-like [Leptidea sinapis]
MEIILALLLTCAVLVEGGVVKENCESHNEVETLKSDLDRPYLLAVDYSTNTVYFSYSLNLDDDVFKTAFVNLNTKEFGEVAGINNGFAQTVDEKNHDIYIGGSDGVYKYSHNAKEAQFLSQLGNIWTLYFKDVLYYSVFPSQFLYTFANGVSARFKDLEDTKVDHFIIDNDDIMFYTNSTGLYGQKKGTKDSVLYREYSKDGVRGLTTDINGNAFICIADGIYKINKVNTSLDKVLSVDDAFGLAFDNENNIVYSDAMRLVRVKSVKSC